MSESSAPFRLIFRSQRGEKRSGARRASLRVASPLSSSRNKTQLAASRRARRESPKHAKAALQRLARA